MRRFTQKTTRACALLFIVLMAADIQAQKAANVTRRVKFPRGRTTAVLKGAVKPGVENDYLLGARAGQSMIVHLTSPGDVGFTIWSPGGEFLADYRTDWSGELPKSGTYTIKVLPNSDKSFKPYTLEVTIR
jgi:hypothetical protein